MLYDAWERTRGEKIFWKLVKKGFTNEKIWCIVILASGLVAQLGERSVRIREVEGSNPFESTTKVPEEGNSGAS